MYSILFMRRRAINQRGTPVRAAAQWCLLEEVRIHLESHFNEDRRNGVRALRGAIERLIGNTIAFHSHISVSFLFLMIFFYNDVFSRV